MLGSHTSVTGLLLVYCASQKRSASADVNSSSRRSLLGTEPWSSFGLLT
jgi:hypothetical protein